MNPFDAELRRRQPAPQEPVAQVPENPFATEMARRSQGGPTFGQAFSRGVDQAQGMAWSALEAMGEAAGGDNMATRLGALGRRVNRAEAEAQGPRASMLEIDSLDSAGQWAKETVAEQIPMMAPSVAGGLTGAAIGTAFAPGAGTLVGGALGAAVPSFVLGTGEVQQAIKERGEDQSAPGHALAGGAAIAALDSILPGRLGGALVGRFGAEAAEQVAQQTIARAAAKGAGKGVTAEAATEALQEAIAELSAAHGTGTAVDPNLGRNMIEAAASGALMGGGVGAVTGAAGARPQADLPPEAVALPTHDDLAPEAWAAQWERGQSAAEVQPAPLEGPTVFPERQAAAPQDPEVALEVAGEEEQAQQERTADAEEDVQAPPAVRQAAYDVAAQMARESAGRISAAEIADATGLSAENVARLYGKLRSDGLIRSALPTTQRTRQLINAEARAAWESASAPTTTNVSQHLPSPAPPSGPVPEAPAPVPSIPLDGPAEPQVALPVAAPEPEASAPPEGEVINLAQAKNDRRVKQIEDYEAGNGAAIREGTLEAISGNIRRLKSNGFAPQAIDRAAASVGEQMGMTPDEIEGFKRTIRRTMDDDGADLSRLETADLTFVGSTFDAIAGALDAMAGPRAVETAPAVPQERTNWAIRQPVVADGERDRPIPAAPPDLPPTPATIKIVPTPAPEAGVSDSGGALAQAEAVLQGRWPHTLTDAERGAVATALGVGPEKVATELDRLGYRASAELPRANLQRQAAPPTPTTKKEPKAPPSAAAAKPANVSRLRTAAANLRARADESFGRDRKANTPRRARMAASAEADAARERMIADTADRLADAVEAGDAPALMGVRTIADVRELDRLLRGAMSRRDVREQRPYHETRDRGPDATDADHAEAPGLVVHASPVREVLDATKGARGLGRARQRVARFGEGDVNRIDDADLVDALRMVAKAAEGTKADYPAKRILEQVATFERVRKLGLTDAKTTREALRQYVALRQGKAKADPVKEAERALVGRKIPGYFPTPAKVADDVISRADIRPGHRVLEPSAGKGGLADRARAAGGTVEAIEVVDDLRTILQGKGHMLAGRDFTTFDGGPYDRIVMNPPFEKRQDVAHVRRAFDLLAEGGKMVAIMSEGPFFGQDATAVDFRAWLGSVGGRSEKLPEGSFLDSDRSTGVATRIVEIEKRTGGDGTRKAPVAAATAEDVDRAAEQVDRKPTEAQKEAGNFAKGHIRWQGLDIAIENPKGSTRSGIAPGGGRWSVRMPNHYGYIKGTRGADGDHVDINIGTALGSDESAGKVYVVDQFDPKSGKFDEHKLFVGFASEADAVAAYDASFSDGSGPSRRKSVTEMTIDQMKAWLEGGPTKRPLRGVVPKRVRDAVRLDHGVLNAPLAKRGDIDADLDRYKAKQQAEGREKERRDGAKLRQDKARAKELFAAHGEAMVARYSASMGKKPAEVRNTLDSMVKWEPAKFIGMVERFAAERASQAPGFRERADAEEFVRAPDGSLDFGKIGAEIEAASGGLYPAGVIRMREGEPDTYGRAHIEFGKMERLRAAGYPSVEAFVFDIAQNYVQAWEQPNQRLLLVKERARYHDAASVELVRAQGGGYYIVSTALPVQKSKRYPQGGGRKLLWERRPTPPSASPGENAPFAPPAEDMPGRQTAGGTSQSSAPIIGQRERVGKPAWERPAQRNATDSDGGHATTDSKLSFARPLQRKGQAGEGIVDPDEAEDNEEHKRYRAALDGVAATPAKHRKRRRVEAAVRRAWAELGLRPQALETPEVVWAGDDSAIRRSGGTATGGAQGVAGMFDPFRGIAHVALNQADPTSAAYHEGWHALRAGLGFSGKELAALEVDLSALRQLAARSLNVLSEDPVLDQLDQEETEAYAFEAWQRARMAGEQTGLSVAVRRLFRRIRQVILRLRAVLEGFGFRRVADVYSAEDVFEVAAAGGIAGRERAAATRDELEYQAGALRQRLGGFAAGGA